MIIHDVTRVHSTWLVVGVLVSGSSSRGSSPGWEHWFMFLGKTLDSHSASLYPGVQMVPTNSMLGVTLQWTSTKIFLVASCYRNRNVVGPLAHMQTLPYRLIGPSTAAAGECLSPVCRAHTIFLPWPLFLHTSIVVCFKGSGNSAAQIYPNQNICVICISPVRVYAYAYTVLCKSNANDNRRISR